MRYVTSGPGLDIRAVSGAVRRRRECQRRIMLAGLAPWRTAILPRITRSLAWARGSAGQRPQRALRMPTAGAVGAHMATVRLSLTFPRRFL